MKKVFFLIIMAFALFGNMQAQTLTPKVVTLGNLRVYPTDLGYFPAVPDSVIAAINQKTSYGYDNWRVPTTKEMALMKANKSKIPGLTNDTYMTSDGQHSGNLRLVSTGKTFAKKEQESTQKEAKQEPPIGHRPPKGQKPDGQKQQAEGQKTDGQKQQAKEQTTDGQKQQAKEQTTDGQKQPPKRQNTDGQKQQAEGQKTDGQKGKTPPHAASTKTWTFGNQTWSDVIRIPECNKETFENSSREPHCRSYTIGGKTHYYYNWPYVDENKARMCASPWRVPTQSDFDVLVKNTTETALTAAWGYSGYALSNSIYYESTHASYWSDTGDRAGSYNLYYNSGALGVLYNAYKRNGCPVRCVK